MKAKTAHPGWIERTELLLGPDKLSLLREAHVLVMGLGGVGATAAELICRMGTGKMTVVDGDRIQPGNLNRQIPALHSTLGKDKAKVMGRRLKDINPDLSLKIYNEFIPEERMDQLLMGPFDYVIDAIDTLSPKISLIQNALHRKIPLVSSMGSGGKLDPSLVRVADISESYNCRLAYVLRKKLRKLGIETGFKVVFSSEKIRAGTVLPVEGERNKKSIVGTSSYIPAIFGGFLASVVIRDLISK